MLWIFSLISSHRCEVKVCVSVESVNVGCSSHLGVHLSSQITKPPVFGWSASAPVRSAHWPVQVFPAALDSLVDFEASVIFSAEFLLLSESIFIVPRLDPSVWWLCLVPAALSVKAGSVSAKTDVCVIAGIQSLDCTGGLWLENSISHKVCCLPFINQSL